MKTDIFYSYIEFKKRPNKSINGVLHSPVHINEPKNQDTRNKIIGRMLDAGFTMDEIQLI